MNSKKAVFILLGQSNATGHASPMTEEDKIKTPLKNVYGLQRRDNQSFDNTKLTWSNYLGAGTNLAEEQDDTYSLANCLAKEWQAVIDGGAYLPDLYIVQIAIGAEGVTEKYMWYPEREKKLIPGKLGTVDISLYPFSNHIFSLLDESLDGDYEIMGIHWRGGEEETDVRVAHLKEVLRGIYDRMFDGFYESLGQKVPVILHKMASETRCREMNVTGEDVEAMHFINKTFDELANDNENITTFDVKNAPHYVENERTNGIFLPDGGHYTPQTNMWAARQILEDYRKSFRTSLVQSYLGKTVRIEIDRPIGTPHPKHPEIIYPINYGYIPGVYGGDGEELDVYILGIEERVEDEVTAKIVGIVYREDDVEDKLVAAPEGMEFTAEEIEKIIHFQEQFYNSHVETM